MAAESAEDVGAADEVEHELLRAQVCDADLRSKVTVSLAHHDRAGKPDPANDQRNEWMGRGGELATGMHCWIKKCIVQCVLFSENKETRVPLACLLVQVIISTSLLLWRALRELEEPPPGAAPARKRDCARREGCRRAAAEQPAAHGRTRTGTGARQALLPRRC